jgi:uncharacterized membrane protein YfcA
MEYVIVCAVALAASFLTLFSGFGLGTMLLPVFAIFFPITLAVSMTAVVHLLNNVFKLALVGRFAAPGVAVRFGLPAIMASFAGAWLLVALSDLPSVFSYTLGGREFTVTPIRLTISSLMILFALLDVVPGLSTLSFSRRYLPLGGFLSGFFGGLSGHQGGLRSAFLMRCGLDARSFVATGVVIACAVDVVRLAVYGSRYDLAAVGGKWGLVAAAVFCAFAGAFAGARLLEKLSINVVRNVVAVMLIAIAIGLGAGIV